MQWPAERTESYVEVGKKEVRDKADIIGTEKVSWKNWKNQVESLEV